MPVSRQRPAGRRLPGPRPLSPTRPAPRKILVVRTDRVGDAVVSTPVIANLRAQFPDAHLTFMCRPYTREIVETHPDLDDVLVFDKEGRHKGLTGALGLLRRLRRARFDCAFVLHPTNRVHILLFLAGIPLRIGWDRKWGFLLTTRLPDEKYLGEKHESEYTLDLLHAAGVEVRETQPRVAPKPRDREAVAAILRRYELRPTERLIGISPDATCPSKRWFPEYFERLVTLLERDPRVRIAVVTSAEHARLADPIVAGHERIIDLRGTLSLSGLGALIERCDLFITNDSGPAHIAAALGRPVISIFGRIGAAMSPRRWKPLGPAAYYMHEDVGCEVCLRADCEIGFECLAEIRPHQVFALAREVLRRHAS